MRRVRIWLPPVAWAAMIFFFSSEPFSGGKTAGIVEPLLRQFFPELSGTGIEIIHVFIRKVGHFAEYFILATLVMRALRQEISKELSLRQLAFALTLTSLYALSDELHQVLVPGRSASIIDVLIDVIGGISGILWSYRRNPGKNPV